MANAFITASNVILWAVAFLLGFLLLGALRALARLTWRLDQLEATSVTRAGRGGLKPGSKAPEFTLPSAAGGEVSLRDYSGRQLLLVFSQPNCAPCHAVVPALNKLHQKDGMDVVVICNGDDAAVRQWTAEVGARFPVLGQEHWKVSKKYEVFATPFGFVIGADGMIRAKGVTSNQEYLGFLLDDARSAAPEGIVESAPENESAAPVEVPEEVR